MERIKRMFLSIGNLALLHFLGLSTNLYEIKNFDKFLHYIFGATSAYNSDLIIKNLRGSLSTSIILNFVLEILEYFSGFGEFDSLDIVYGAAGCLGFYGYKALRLSLRKHH
jgi:hypothetical protein